MNPGAVCLLVSVLAAPLAAQQTSEPAPPQRERRSGYESRALDGPNSVAGQLAEDDAVKSPVFRFPALDDALQPWFDWKRQLNEDTRIQLGLSYAAVYQHASASLGDDDAAGGIAQLNAQWTAIGRGSSRRGSVVFKLENRHRLGTDVSPNGLGAEIGSSGATGYGYANFGIGVLQLNYKHEWVDERITVIAGRVQPIAYFDTYALVNPLTGFLNRSFSYSPAVAIPSSGLGVAAGGALGDHLYLVGSLSDANGSNTQAGFDTFFDDHEYFKHVEFGWYSSFERRKLDNIHATLWHADARERAGTPESWGSTFSASWFVEDTWMPFLRGGYSDGGAAPLRATVSAGAGLYVRERGDLVGLGLSWGNPSASGLRDEYVGELFYRLQLAQNLAITPDVQVIVDPASNPNEDVIGVFGVRGRVTF